MSHLLRRNALVLLGLLSLLLGGCYSRTPAIGDLVINSDLPPVERVLLPVGITLNNTGSTGRDLLSDNLVLNGTFDLAQIPTLCAFDASTQTITTPNGYTTFYPAPGLIYGWKTTGAVSYVPKSEKSSVSGHLSFYPTLNDSIQCTARQEKYSFPVRKGESFHLSMSIFGKSSEVEVLLMSDSTKTISNIYSASTQEQWRKVEGTLKVNADSDTAYLVIRAKAVSQIDTVTTTRTHSQNAYSAAVDNIKLTTGKSAVSQLQSILADLPPSFVRFPSGRAANGFYPGTYPIWWRDSLERLRPEVWPIWTLERGEMTGDFKLEHFFGLTSKIGTIPILIENSGFTDEKAMQRIEDVALLPNRIERIFGVVNSHKHDSLIVQLGYGISNPEYEKRFSAIAADAKKNGLNASLMSAGSLLWNDRKYSDNVIDLELPPISRPDIRSYIPSKYHSAEQAPEPIMLGEVKFANQSDTSSFIPLFVLKAATLIDVEKNSNLLRGISVAPFLSEDESSVPMVLVKGGEYIPTTFLEFVKSFITMRGNVLRQIPQYSSSVNGLITSLTSDSRGRNFYLKVANVTRHPLTYNLKIKGRHSGFSHMNVIRFNPVASMTTDDKKDFVTYKMSEEKIKTPFGASSQITFDSFEVTIIHFTSDKNGDVKKQKKK